MNKLASSHTNFDLASELEKEEDRLDQMSCKQARIITFRWI